MLAERPTYRFIDLFAGCGGLSLGLSQAGLQGVFAIEQDACAFETFRANLLQQNGAHCFDWPRWLPKEPISISDAILHHRGRLEELSGTVDLLAGGPPCQGFSSAGRRLAGDPRNQLLTSYLQLVNLVHPAVVLFENVRGFTIDFRTKSESTNYHDDVVSGLSSHYDVSSQLIDMREFGVPQGRTRIIILGFRKELNVSDPFERLHNMVPGYLRSLGLRTPVSARDAISDLEVRRCGTRPSRDTVRFEEINYQGPLSTYQRFMSSSNTAISDLRLPNHTLHVARRFAQIIEMCQTEGRLNRSLSDEMRSHFGLKKRAIRVLDPDKPAPTITSMPDDLLHYDEPRVLTVRENARLQSFPDWFAFRGKYTTGGERRRREVPRYTQVANAVPPLAARALGLLVIEMLQGTKKSTEYHSTSLEVA